MRLFLPILLLFFVSCAQPPVKTPIKETPVFSTKITNPELKTITDEYFRLSARNNITFNGRVSMGFSDIERGRVIGTCTFRPTFREIDLDKNFWIEATWYSKVALVFHEMSHCYCQRDHDYDNGKMYPDDSLKAILQGIFARQPFTPLRPPGYLEDGCPKSIMHPVIMSDECFVDHYKYYVKEMFARCDPF